MLDRPAGEEIEPYLKRRGYRKFHRQKINDFYVRIDDPADDLCSPVSCFRRIRRVSERRYCVHANS